MSLSEVDRLLLQRCLDGAPRAWQDFVDRFLGLVIHVAHHTAKARGIPIDDSERDDLVSDVFLELLARDMAALRRFRRNCSLATYLTVIARRVVVRRLTALGPENRAQSFQESFFGAPPHGQAESHGPATHGNNGNPVLERMTNQDEVRQLMTRLDPQEASLVRMYHLEGKSYREISESVGMAENSIGPALSRARAKMRNGTPDAKDE